MNKCEDCKFSIEHIKEDEFACLRFPPVLIRVKENSGPLFSWPTVLGGEWCGEFKKKGGMF